MGFAGRHILFEYGEAYINCGELGDTLSEPLDAACFCRRQASGTDIPNTVPVLEYCPAEGLVLTTWNMDMYENANVICSQHVGKDIAGLHNSCLLFHYKTSACTLLYANSM